MSLVLCDRVPCRLYPLRPLSERVRQRLELPGKKALVDSTPGIKPPHILCLFAAAAPDRSLERLEGAARVLCDLAARPKKIDSFPCSLHFLCKANSQQDLF